MNLLKLTTKKGSEFEGDTVTTKKGRQKIKISAVWGAHLGLRQHCSLHS